MLTYVIRQASLQHRRSDRGEHARLLGHEPRHEPGRVPQRAARASPSRRSRTSRSASTSTGRSTSATATGSKTWSRTSSARRRSTTSRSAPISSGRWGTRCSSSSWPRCSRSLIAVGIGVYSALRQYSVFDYTATTGSFVGLAIPVFWLALMLQVLFVNIYLWFDVRIFYVAGLSSADPGTASASASTVRSTSRCRSWCSWWPASPSTLASCAPRCSRSSTPTTSAPRARRASTSSASR